MHIYCLIVHIILESELMSEANDKQEMNDKLSNLRFVKFLLTQFKLLYTHYL